MSARPEPCIRIDGEIVETDSVTAGLPESAPSFHRIDLQISVQTVLHELQECGVEVSEQTLADFLKQDAQDDRGRDAYLLMAQRCRRASRPRWRWIENWGIQVCDGVVTFSGVVIQHDHAA